MRIMLVVVMLSCAACPNDPPGEGEGEGAEGEGAEGEGQLVECTANAQCIAQDAGSSDRCSSAADCEDGDACVPATNGTASCVFPNDPPGSDCGPGFSEATTTDVDGAVVLFCGDTSVGCVDGTCHGGFFD